MMMTRLLQHWFTADRTFFIVVLRHPFATMRDKLDAFDFDDCGARAVEHWLYIHDALFEDLRHIKNKLVFHYETFALGNTQRMCVIERLCVVQ